MDCRLPLLRARIITRIHDKHRSPESITTAAQMTLAITGLQIHLREILASHPAGLSEYELLKELAGRGVGLFDEEYFHNPLGLFQRHFLLFHCLYLMREQLCSTGQGDMDIHCLCIRLVPCIHRDTSRSEHPALPDPLAAYYLDLDNLKTTDESDVLRMLDAFWNKFAGHEQRDEALAVLALTHPTDYAAIRQRYRRLAMQHHPDRGGEPARFQRLEWAMGILRIVYR